MGRPSPKQVAASGAAAKKLKDAQPAAAKSQLSTKGKKKVAVGDKKQVAASGVAAKKVKDAEPSAAKAKLSKKSKKKVADGDKDEENDGGVTKAHKEHHTHDEKKRMKHIRNKLRDGVELTDDEKDFAAEHNIEVDKKAQK